MVFADVIAEEIDAGGVGAGCVGQSVEMRAAEHIAFADDTGCDGDGGDSGVEFRVRGREEEFFEEGTPVPSSLPLSLWYSFTIAGAGCGGGQGLRYIDDER